VVAIDIHPIATIAAKELRDAKRHRWFVLFATLFAGLAIVLSLAGFWGMGVTGFAGFSRTAASLSNLVALIVPLMGLMLGSMSITNEREKGTLEILLAQPISLSEVLLGKWFGLSAALTAAVLLGFGLSGLVIASSTTTEQIGAYLHLLVFTLLLGYANLSVGVLISTLSAKKLHIRQHRFDFLACCRASQ
jgi:Cu-processing system permease protein